MKFSTSQLTLFAIISSIERDLRECIRKYSGEEYADNFFGEDTLDRAIERKKKDEKIVKEREKVKDVIKYVSFSESYELINRNDNKFPKRVCNYISDITEYTEEITPVRHKVVHSRPLDEGDFPRTLDIAREISSTNKSFWQNLNDTLDKLSENPSFVLDISIPDYYEEENKVNNNLPIPDFNETGFIGRENELDRVIQLCVQPSVPVVSILGEGGIGKTALALKSAYKVAYNQPDAFDSVVWTSSKTKKLTRSEITSISDSIGTSTGVFTNFSDELAGTEREPIKEVKMYMEEFDILLIMDNLETVLDGKVRGFLKDTSTIPGSKVLVTSRIGVGSLNQVELDPLRGEHAVQLLRKLSSIRNVDYLTRIGNAKLRDYCERMRYNPLWIKWFVSSVQDGSRPEDILENPDELLEFCMSNVYNHLSRGAKDLLDVFLADAREQSIAELQHFTEMNTDAVKEGVQELISTNMVSMVGNPTGRTYETNYLLSDLAYDYLISNQPVKSEIHQDINEKRVGLQAVKRSLSSKEGGTVYNIDVSSDHQLVSAKFLREGLKKAQNGNQQNALELIKKAEEITPGYYEVYRVKGWVESQRDNLPAASRAYDTALDLAPKNARLRKRYGSYLLSRVHDSEAAAKQFAKAEDLDETILEETDFRLKKARAFMYSSLFEECEEEIEFLSNRETGNIKQWEQRKFLDLKLNLYRVWANHLLEENNYLPAADKVTEFADELRESNEFIMDSGIYSECGRMISTGKNILSDMHRESTSQERIESFAENLDIIRFYAGNIDKPRSEGKTDYSGQRYTRKVKRIFKHDLFGFINFDHPKVDEDLYFNFEDVTNTMHWAKIQSGDRVSFSLGENPEGTCAIEVALEYKVDDT